MGGITAKTNSELHGSAIEGLVDCGWYVPVENNFSKVQMLCFKQNHNVDKKL